MTYALIVDGAVSAYPYSFAQLCRDHPDVSFPRAPSDSWLAEQGVVKVAGSVQPAPSVDKNIVEGPPALINGVWTQTWAKVDATPEETAERAKRAIDTAQRETIKADAFVSNFIAMTPAEVAAYVDANVTSLATAKTVLAKLGIMVLLLARREFR